METIGNSNPRFITAEEGEKVEIFKTQVIMIEDIIKVGTDQTVEKGEFN